MNKRTKATLTLAGLLALPVAVASTANADDGRSCTAIGRFISGNPAPVTVPADAPHGAEITVRTWDNYFFAPTLGDRALAPTQTSERVSVTAGGVTVVTDDLPDGTDVSLDTVFTVEGPVTGIVVAHVTDGTSPNSVVAEVCYTALPAPAPETTVPPTVPETTVPETTIPEPTVPPTVPVETTPAPEVVVEASVATPVPARPAFTG